LVRTHHPLYHELACIVGPKYVSDEDFVCYAYSRDSTPYPPSVQGIVVRPVSLEEVVSIVQLANQTRTPIIPSGGRASMFGASPGLPGKGIVVDMTRMNKIVEVDLENMHVTVEAGLGKAELNARLLRNYGLEIHNAQMPYYAVTVGGHTSGMAHGGGSLYDPAHGPGPYILGVKVVLGNGKVVETGNGPGTISTTRISSPYTHTRVAPEVTNLFVGSAGLFGILVEVTYLMFRSPKVRASEAYVFDSFEDAWKTYREMSKIDGALYIQAPSFKVLASPECMSALTFGMAPKVWTIFTGVYALDEEEADLKIKKANEMVERCGGKIGESAAREMAGVMINPEKGGLRDMGATAGTMGMWVLFEVCPPATEIPECFHTSREWLNKRFKELGVSEDEVSRTEFLLGDVTGGVTSFIIYYDSTNLELEKKLYQMHREYYEWAAKRGWFPDVNHGLATKLMARYWTPEFYDFMRTLKDALDPNHIMNPGIYNF